MPSGGHNKLDRDELLRAIADLHDELGETPRLKDWRERGEYSAKAVYNEFDSWNAALDELDMDKHHVVNKERLTFECDGPNCDETVEKVPSDAAASERHYCSQECHYAHKSERFSGDGNPQSTLEEIECDNCGDAIVRPNWDRERYERHFCDNRCYGEWCSEVRHGENHPVWMDYPVNECEWCGASYKIKPAKQTETRFCSFECMTSWKCEAYEADGNPNWAGGKDHYMGANWEEQRLKALIRDQARCRRCGMTDAEHLRTKGRGLHIHHKRPRSEFRDDDGNLNWHNANKLSNLTSLCTSCHGYAEGFG